VGQAINLANSAFIQKFASVAAFKASSNDDKLAYLKTLSGMEEKLFQRGDRLHAAGFGLFKGWVGAVAADDAPLVQQLTKGLAELSRVGDMLGPIGASPTKEPGPADYDHKERATAAQVEPAPTYEDGLAAFRKGDYATVLRVWLPLAEQGHVDAQTTLGLMYSEGQGVPQDLAAAISWFRKAAEQDHALAQYLIGRLYAEGRGVPQDYVQAVAWYRKAADRGHANAQNAIGFLYAKGHGVPQDYVQAAAWYRKAAEQDDVSAQFALGKMYYGGQGVPKDATAATAWFRRAAEQGHAPAQHLLGAMYSKSLEELVQAYMWLTLAASRYGAPEKENRDRVLGFRGMLAVRMTPAQIAEAEKLAREWKPSR
jgi:TPR repeat protein